MGKFTFCIGYHPIRHTFDSFQVLIFSCSLENITTDILLFVFNHSITSCYICKEKNNNLVIT